MKLFTIVGVPFGSGASSGWSNSEEKDECSSFIPMDEVACCFHAYEWGRLYLPHAFPRGGKCSSCTPHFDPTFSLLLNVGNEDR